MNGLRFPLWLICDAKAAIRLALATCMLSLQVRLHWPKRAVTAPTPEGVACITIWLSCAEALLRWAITRQALRICGLDPRGARIFQLPEAASSFIWQARCRTFLRLITNMSLYARRWATRIQAARATTPSGVPAQPVVAPSPRRFFCFFAPAFVSPPAGQRIRAPPWLRPFSEHQSPSQPADLIRETETACPKSGDRPASLSTSHPRVSEAHPGDLGSQGDGTRRQSPRPTNRDPRDAASGLTRG